MKLIIRYLLVSTLFFSFFFLTTLPDNNLHIISCDVGQGDATLITQGFTQVLVDGGPTDQVMQCLSKHMPWLDDTIEIVVLTHPHLDHFKGLLSVIGSYEVNLFLANETVSSAKDFNRLRNMIWEKQIKTVSPRQPQTLKAGELRFTILLPQDTYEAKSEVWPSVVDENSSDNDVIKVHHDVFLEPFAGDLNATSIVMRLTYKDVSMLLTGDMTTREEQALMTQGVISVVDILKVAHHGSKYSSNPDFLKLLSPKWALVSVGKGNRYGHPSSDTLMHLDAIHAKVLRTDIMGEIELVSDGRDIWSLQK